MFIRQVIILEDIEARNANFMQKSNGKNGKKTEGKLKARVPLPDFKNLEEEIEFWETHALTDYRDYWREVKDVKIELARPPHWC